MQGRAHPPRQRGPASCRLTENQNTAKRIANTPADKSPEPRKGRPGLAVLPQRIASDRVMPKRKTSMAANVAEKDTPE